MRAMMEQGIHVIRETAERARALKALCIACTGMPQSDRYPAAATPIS